MCIYVFLNRRAFFRPWRAPANGSPARDHDGRQQPHFPPSERKSNSTHIIVGVAQAVIQTPTNLFLF